MARARRVSRGSALFVAAVLLTLSCIYLSPSTLQAHTSFDVDQDDLPDNHPAAVAATFQKGVLRAAVVVAAMSVPRLLNISHEVNTAAKVVSAAALVGATMNTPGLHNATTVELRRVLHIPTKQLTIFNEKYFGPVNFDRANMRLGAMDDYAVIASILIAVIMGLFGAFQGNPPEKDAPMSAVVAFDAGLALTTIGMLCSTWALLIFLFNKLYCVKALSMYNDVSYDVFLKATEHYRRRAFRMLLSGFFCYLMAYNCSLFSNYGGKKGAIGFALALVFGIIIMYEMDSLLTVAGDETHFLWA